MTSAIIFIGLQRQINPVPDGYDCFYVLVPVPNNQSNINWKVEGEKVNLVIEKMEKDLMLI